MGSQSALWRRRPRIPWRNRRMVPDDLATAWAVGAVSLCRLDAQFACLCHGLFRRHRTCAAAKSNGCSDGATFRLPVSGSAFAFGNRTKSS